MIVVIGEILIDIFQDYQRIGGAPFNFAFHLRKLGFSVRFITRVGDDRHGHRIIDMLVKNGFNEADIQVDPRHPTGTVNVDLDDQGIPSFDICENVAYDHLDLNASEVLDAGEQGMIYFGTLLQRTDSGRSHVDRFVSRMNNSTTRFCDVNLRPPHVNVNAVAGSLHHADLLKINEAELVVIQNALGGPSDNGAVMPWLMDAFRINTVALTRGSRGSTLYNRDGRIDTPAIPGPPVVDTVGAGDAYAAILAAGCMQKLPWEETLRLASRFAARICGIAGAVPDNANFYDDFKPLMKGDANGR